MIYGKEQADSIIKYLRLTGTELALDQMEFIRSAVNIAFIKGEVNQLHENLKGGISNV